MPVAYLPYSSSTGSYILDTSFIESNDPNTSYPTAPIGSHSHTRNLLPSPTATQSPLPASLAHLTHRHPHPPLHTRNPPPAVPPIATLTPQLHPLRGCAALALHGSLASPFPVQELRPLPKWINGCAILAVHSAAKVSLRCWLHSLTRPAPIWALSYCLRSSSTLRPWLTPSSGHRPLKATADHCYVARLNQVCIYVICYSKITHTLLITSCCSGTTWVSTSTQARVAEVLLKVFLPLMAFQISTLLGCG